MKTNLSKYKNNKDIKLVLSGSGTLYPVHIGAIKAIDELGFNITHICGVSGGSIVAAGVALGNNIKDIEEVIKETLPGPNKLIDYSWWPFSKYGFVKGIKVLNKLREKFPGNFKKTKKHLSIITANINTKSVNIFNTTDTPDYEIAKVIRASLSIPGLFKHVNIDGDIHVDGGLLYNFPIDIYGDDENVIGLKICYDSCGQCTRNKVESLRDYILTLIDSIFVENAREQIEDAKKATVINLRVNEKFINLKMDHERCSEIIQQGYDAVMEYFKNK